MDKTIYKNYDKTQAVRGGDTAAGASYGMKIFDAYFGATIKNLYREKKGDLAVTDIGCGHGLFLDYLRRLGVKDISGVDLSEGMVRLAKKRGLSQVVVGDGLAFLNKSKKQYDLITAFDVLEHLELDYLISFLKKIRERLKPGGMFIAQTPNGHSPLSPNLYGDVTHVRAFTPNSFRQVFLMAGFEESQITFRPMPIVVVNVKTWIRRLAWDFLIRPVVYFYLAVVLGNQADKIFTGNLAVFVRR